VITLGETAQKEEKGEERRYAYAYGLDILSKLIIKSHFSISHQSVGSSVGVNSKNEHGKRRITIARARGGIPLLADTVYIDRGGGQAKEREGETDAGGCTTADKKLKGEEECETK
jgi:hypothetical protein